MRNWTGQTHSQPTVDAGAAALHGRSPDGDGVETRVNTAPAITLDDVTVDRGGRTVLAIERLAIERGYTALVGPNGSGKSTLLHAISGLITPSSGTIDFDDSVALERRISYVLQTQHASERLLVTAREIVALGYVPRLRHRLLGRTDRNVVDQALERLEITALADRHLADMSGGQRQRVFIAQGLVQDSDIMLLDEPVAGLDLASTQVIRRAIDDQRAAGKVVIVATHDLDEATRADHVVMLNCDVVASGPPADVLRAVNLRRAYQGRVLEIGDGLVTVDDDHHH